MNHAKKLSTSPLRQSLVLLENLPEQPKEQGPIPGSLAFRKARSSEPPRPSAMAQERDKRRAKLELAEERRQLIATALEHEANTNRERVENQKLLWTAVEELNRSRHALRQSKRQARRLEQAAERLEHQASQEREKAEFAHREVDIAEDLVTMSAEEAEEAKIKANHFREKARLAKEQRVALQAGEDLGAEA